MWTAESAVSEIYSVGTDTSVTGSDSVKLCVSSEPEAEAPSESAPVAPPEDDEVILTNLSLLFLSRFLPADDTLVVYLLLFR